jgi:hypothetical protein
MIGRIKKSKVSRYVSLASTSQLEKLRQTPCRVAFWRVVDLAYDFLCINYTIQRRKEK